MKKSMTLLINIMLLFSLAACGSHADNQQSSKNSIQTENSKPVTEKVSTEGISAAADENMPLEESTKPAATTESADISETENDKMGKILIAYFSVPEDVDPTGTDAVSGASIVVREGEVMGNTEYVAKVIQQTIGGELFRIETVQQYPLDHDPLVDQAAEEQDADARPELADHIENPDQYDTIILGYPNWWGDMPQPLYTFLEEYDLSGKTIIPFVTHGGSGFSNTRNTISVLQPDATVVDYTFSLSRDEVADSEADIIAWAESLGVN